ncbi:MAG: hypothetical protein PGN09_07215 [Sphingomonas fennica]
MTPHPPPSATGPAPPPDADNAGETSPADERAYLLRRAADHDRLAEAAPADGRRALHRQFATLYRGRADDPALMQED